ncbi:MAG: virD4 [Rickettsiaceae bacterium]|jgi:type IV secretion system protein VirD4|nr:virD4 [Rickettsiaceae bacterium]
MDDSKFILAARNFVIVTIGHICMLLGVIWISGVFVAYFTNELHLIGLDDNAIEIAYKWGKWLISVWSQLPYDGYNYLKIKLVSSLILPFVIGIILYIINFDKIKAWRPYKPREKVYGDASWASPADVERAGLRAKHGMLLGIDNKGYFVADGFQHALLFAPTGSGKGVGFVIPNLLFWDHSVVVHDIKLENHELTSGWRAQQGQQVFVWEPANPDGKTHCYNPIDWVSQKPGQMVDDVQKISNLIMPEKDFWNNEARSLFVGVVLYLIADPSKPKSFGEVVRTMRSDDVVYNLAVVLDTLGKVIHPVAYMNLAAFLQKADKERSGVISTLNSSLELWANPLIDTATASSDFNIQEFKKKRTTVYVGLTPDNIQRLQKLMQVFYQQATEFLSRKMPDIKEEPYGVMFLMDEFPTLGKMEQFKSGIAYFRGYRVRLFLIIQDTQQLKGTYEEAGMNSFLSNSTYRITFAANNYETANLISQLCGNKTVQQTSQSKPKFFDLNPATRTVNVSEVQRALLLPQEVIQLPRDEQIVLIESFPPIKSKKIKYFDDKFFTKRLLPPTLIPIQEPYDPRKDSAEEEVEEDLVEEEYEEEEDTDSNEEFEESTEEDNYDDELYDEEVDEATEQNEVTASEQIEEYEDATEEGKHSSVEEEAIVSESEVVAEQLENNFEEQTSQRNEEAIAQQETVNNDGAGNEVYEEAVEDKAQNNPELEENYRSGEENLIEESHEEFKEDQELETGEELAREDAQQSAEQNQQNEELEPAEVSEQEATELEEVQLKDYDKEAYEEFLEEEIEPSKEGLDKEDLEKNNDSTESNAEDSETDEDIIANEENDSDSGDSANRKSSYDEENINEDLIKDKTSSEQPNLNTSNPLLQKKNEPGNNQ